MGPVGREDEGGVGDTVRRSLDIYLIRGCGSVGSSEISGYRTCMAEWGHTHMTMNRR